MAKKKISGLPAGSALNGTELIPMVQGGTTKRTTAQDIANLSNAIDVDGSGTINRLAKFTASSTIGNSQLFDDGTSVGLGTITPLGLLHLFKASATTRMVIDGNASQNRIISYRTNAVQRFGLYVNNTAESGANAGSDFAIRAYSDTGTLLATPLFIKRSNGNVLINTTTDVGFKLDVNGNGRFSSSITTDANFVLSPTASAKLVIGSRSGGANFDIYNRFNIFRINDTLNDIFTVTSGSASFNGNLSLVNGLSLSGATAPASGIQFPVTQVASASANNLDDYEEGTWTIGITFGGASVGITYGQNTGTYTKVGRQVTINGYVNLTNKGTSTGITKITGLPFTIPNSVANYSSASLWYNNIAVLNELINLGVINTTTIGIEQISTLGVISSVSDTNFTNTSAIAISFTYFV